MRGFGFNHEARKHEGKERCVSYGAAELKISAV
jgi:hypothetical protein